MLRYWISVVITVCVQQKPCSSLRVFVINFRPRFYDQFCNYIVESVATWVRGAKLSDWGGAPQCGWTLLSKRSHSSASLGRSMLGYLRGGSNALVKPQSQEEKGIFCPSHGKSVPWGSYGWGGASGVWGTGSTVVGHQTHLPGMSFVTDSVVNILDIIFRHSQVADWVCTDDLRIASLLFANYVFLLT